MCIHHSDRGVQYLSIRYTNRLEAANLRASVGTTGDSYDNALAETVNGLYKNVPMTKLKYTPEIRERAVQLLIESEKDYPSNWAAITAIAP